MPIASNNNLPHMSMKLGRSRKVPRLSMLAWLSVASPEYPI